MLELRFEAIRHATVNQYVGQSLQTRCSGLSRLTAQLAVPSVDFYGVTSSLDGDRKKRGRKVWSGLRLRNDGAYYLPFVDTIVELLLR